MNLIVTCGRNLESEAKNEIKKIINELGDQELEILNSGMRGVLTVNTSVKPSEVIDHARNKINEEPWFMRYCLRIIPIQIVTEMILFELQLKREVQLSQLRKLLQILQNPFPTKFRWKNLLGLY